MDGQLWVEPVGDLIIARVRGCPTEALLRECQERVLQIARDNGEGDYHVFHSDMIAAIRWLTGPPAA
jgi:hypothetical protein